jgi:hypothetical protein
VPFSLYKVQNTEVVDTNIGIKIEIDVTKLITIELVEIKYIDKEIEVHNVKIVFIKIREKVIYRSSY